MASDVLDGRVALITGGARRIGAEITNMLHEAGMNIVLHYNMSENDAHKLAENLNQKRPNSVITVRAELAEPESEKELIKAAIQNWDRLDVLVNNASKFYKTQIGEVTPYAWDDLLDANLKAPFFLAQAAAPYLTKNRGTIINITDIHAETPLRDYAVYCISKGGLVMMTKVLAKELGPHIRVNGVAPGAIIWPEGSNTLSEAEKHSIIDKTCLQKVGEATDIAKAVLFFVRDAPYVTGQVLAVDGGRSV